MEDSNEHDVEELSLVVEEEIEEEAVSSPEVFQTYGRKKVLVETSSSEAELEQDEVEDNRNLAGATEPVPNDFNHQEEADFDFETLKLSLAYQPQQNTETETKSTNQEKDFNNTFAQLNLNSKKSYKSKASRVAENYNPSSKLPSVAGDEYLEVQPIDNQVQLDELEPMEVDEQVQEEDVIQENKVRTKKFLNKKQQLELKKMTDKLIRTAPLPQLDTNPLYSLERTSLKNTTFVSNFLTSVSEKKKQNEKQLALLNLKAQVDETKLKYQLQQREGYQLDAQAQVLQLPMDQPEFQPTGLRNSVSAKLTPIKPSSTGNQKLEEELRLKRGDFNNLRREVNRLRMLSEVQMGQFQPQVKAQVDAEMGGDLGVEAEVELTQSVDFNYRERRSQNPTAQLDEELGSEVEYQNSLGASVVEEEDDEITVKSFSSHEEEGNALVGGELDEGLLPGASQPKGVEAMGDSEVDDEFQPGPANLKGGDHRAESEGADDLLEEDSDDNDGLVDDDATHTNLSLPRPSTHTFTDSDDDHLSLAQPIFKQAKDVYLSSPSNSPVSSPIHRPGSRFLDGEGNPIDYLLDMAEEEDEEGELVQYDSEEELEEDDAELEQELQLMVASDTEEELEDGEGYANRRVLQRKLQDQDEIAKYHQLLGNPNKSLLDDQLDWEGDNQLKRRYRNFQNPPQGTIQAGSGVELVSPGGRNPSTLEPELELGANLHDLLNQLPDFLPPPPTTHCTPTPHPPSPKGTERNSTLPNPPSTRLQTNFGGAHQLPAHLMTTPTVKVTKKLKTRSKGFGGFFS